MQGLTWLLFLLLLLAVVVGTVQFLSRRRAVWRRFARRHELFFEDHEERPRVYGIVDGHKFDLTVAPRSSDTGILGVEVSRMSLELDAHLPAGFEVRRADPGALVSEKLEHHEPLQTGDEAFDHAAIVHGRSPDEVRAFLNDGRRGAIRDLLEAEANRDAGISEGRLYLEERRMIERMPRLERQLDRLARAAERIESPG